MLKKRRLARAFLCSSDRKTFLDVVYNAKVSPRQKQILYRHLLDDKDCGFIADELAVSVETVKKDLQKAYDLTFSYLLKTKSIPNDNPILA